ncbi:polycystin-1-like protein 2 [Saccoglossus kowalevskii]|uniref:Polycystic kidney disease protein 1-like 2-like n=1 Tax=Saccoglossus kowalevskii TaxID=10224 RepID=A0ABM0M1B8_SACKO|nr:PREDICTED: polycystic kidney disease protein 1-like 2-like [Saccoglossus kowalevskii]
MNTVSDAILNQTESDADPIEIKSDAFAVKLQRSNPSNMTSQLKAATGGGNFKLPMGELFGDAEEPVATQLTSFEGNPYNFDSKTASSISGPTIALSLKRNDGEEMQVSGLNEGIVISMPSSLSEVPEPTFVTINEENATDIFYFKVRVNYPNTAIRIDVTLLPEGDSNFTYTVFNVSLYYENITNNLTFDIEYITNTTFFVPDQEIILPGEYLIAINECGPDFANFTIDILTFTCRYWDEEEMNWSSEGCSVLDSSDWTGVVCSCSHLSTFGSGFKMIPPNPIDFSTVFSKFKDLNENASVFSAVFVIFGIYLIVIIWARRADKKDDNQGVMPLTDNNEHDEFLYKIEVFTDVRKEAHTKSNVFITVIGDNSRTCERQLKYDGMRGFRRGGIVRFVMAASESLGTIQGIKIWHDNTGKQKSASWCLGKMKIEDVQTNDLYFFTCNRWLAVDKDDGKIERFLKASDTETLGSARGAFVSKANQDLLDGHLWFSVIGRPASSHFTRVQRASCCLSLLYTSMIANAMFYKTEETNENDFVIHLGPLSISWHQLYVGFMSSMVVFPVNLAIVQLFRKSRPTNVKFDFKRKKKNKKKRKNKNKVTNITTNKTTKLDHLNHNGSEPEWDPGVAKDEGNNGNYLQLAGTINTINNKEQQDSLSKALDPLKWGKTENTDTHIMDGIPTQVDHGSASSADDLRALLDGTPDSAVDEEEHQLDDKKDKKKNKDEEEFWLPHWCLYIGWLLVFLSSSGSAFFTILYSLEWGHKKASSWLVSLLVSFLQDVIFMQPIKVIILAIIITVIMKMIRKRKGEDNNADEYLQDTENEDGFNVNDKDLMKAKELKKREETMWSFFKEIFVYCIFVITVLLIAYGQRDLRSFYMHKSVKDIFIDNGQFASLSSGIADFYIWVDEVLLPGLYPTEAYNGEKFVNINKNLKKFIDDGGLSYRIGPPRFRQLRVKPDACTPPKETSFLFHECNGGYMMTEQDEADYGYKWSEHNPNDTSRRRFRDQVWKYNTMTELEGVPLYGIENLYSGGGYVAVLGNTLWDATNRVKYLFDNRWLDERTRGLFVEFTLYNPHVNLFRWLDERTRGLFVEFTLYNPHVNLFSMFTLLLEYPTTGGALIYAKIDVLRLYNYVGSMTVVVAACEVLFIIMLIYYMVKALMDIRKQKKKYFVKFWNLIEVFKISMCILALSMRGYKALFFDLALEELSADDGATTFINLQQMAAYDEAYGYVIASIVFFGTLQFINLMRFNARMALLSTTLKGAVKVLANYAIIFYIVFFAYGQLLFLTVGRVLESYHTFFTTIKTLYLMWLGHFDYAALEFANPILAPLVFFTLMLFVYAILTTLFVTVIVWQYEWAKELTDQQSNDIVDFMYWKFMTLVGMNKHAKKYDPWIEKEEDNDDVEEECDGTKEKENETKDEKPKETTQLAPKPKTRRRRRLYRRKELHVAFKLPADTDLDNGGVNKYGYGELDALQGRLDYIFDKLQGEDSDDVKKTNMGLQIAMMQFGDKQPRNRRPPPARSSRQRQFNPRAESKI